MNLERKSLPVDLTSDPESGILRGYANVFGNLDRAGEVVVKGAFQNLGGFVNDGFLAVDHDWSVPVGYLKSATQDEHGLLIEAVFHDTERAQEVRTVVLERLAAGKSVSMSIGYRVLADEWVDGVRYLSAVELFEASVVTVPANPEALVIGAKSAEPEEAAEAHAEEAVEPVDNSLAAKRAYLHYLHRRVAA